MRAENRPLTAIRGIAALWVVLHHVQPTWWPGLGGYAGAALEQGYLAVDVFFVLSGFILAIVYRDLTGSFTPAFWMKRLLRVFPLNLCVIAALGLQAVLSEWRNPGLNHPWGTFVPSALMLQSYLLPSTGWNPPTWSVGVELGCYALFPLLISALRPLGQAGLVAVAAVLCVAEWWVLGRFGGAIVGEGAVLRGIVGFALGAILSGVAGPLGARAATALELVAVGAFLFGLAAHDTPLVVLSSAALIVALLAETGLVARLLSHPVPVWLGAVSFSMYLLHAPVIGLVIRLTFLDSPWLRTIVLLALLLPMSELTYRFIEQPGRRLRWRWPAWVRPPSGSGRRPGQFWFRPPSSDAPPSGSVRRWRSG